MVAECGDLESAKSYAQESLTLFQRAGNEQKGREALLELARIRCELAEFDGATDHAGEAVRLADAQGDLPGKAGCLEILGEIRAKADDSDAARGYWEDARALFEELQDPRG